MRQQDDAESVSYTFVGSNSIQLTFVDGSSSIVGIEAVQASPILMNTIETLTEGRDGVIALPTALSASLIKAWASVAVGESLLPDSADMLAKCIQAADFLADEGTLDLSCAAFAVDLFPNGLRTEPTFVEALLKFTPEIIIKVLATSVHSLNVHINLLPSKVHVEAVYAAYPSILATKSLNLDSRCVTMESAITALTCFSGISSPVELKVLGCPLGSSVSDFSLALASALSSYPRAVSLLRVQSSVLTGMQEHLISIAPNLGGLTELRLEGSPLSSTCMATICGVLALLTELQVLSLAGSTIGDSGAVQLAERMYSLSDLRELDLGSNSIGDNGAQSLAASFTCLRSLKELNLPCNRIGDDGIGAVAETLRHMPELCVLTLQNNSFMDSGCEALAAGLPFARNLQMMNLNMNCVWDNAEALSHSLAALTCLTYLDFADCKIGDFGASALSTSFSHLTQLRLLCLSFNFIQDPDGYITRSLGVLTNLRCLDLAGNPFGSEGAEGLALSLRGLSSLEILNLSGNTIGDVGVEVLSATFPMLTSLRELRLGNNSIGLQGTSVLAKHLHFLASLEILNLSGNRMGRAGSAELTRGISTLTSLKDLSLAYNGVADEGAKCLTEQLHCLRALKTLLLEGNGIGDDGAIALAEGIVSVHLLERFSITGSAGSLRHSKPIGVPGALAIADAMRQCTGLKYLCLVRTNMGDEGCSKLAQCISSLQHLSVLSLGSNSIGDQGSIAVASIISSLQELRELLLSSNQIGDEGAVALVNNVTCLVDLRRLNLADNLISPNIRNYIMHSCGEKYRSVLSRTPKIDL